MLATSEKRLRWMGMDMRRQRRRRVVVCCTYLVLFLLMMQPVHSLRNFYVVVVVTMLCVQFSVFRQNGLVKSFEDPPMTKPGMRTMAKLYEWAYERYGIAELGTVSEEMKSGTRSGRYYRPRFWSQLDERETGERDGASRWALQQLAYILTIYAGVLAAMHRPLEQVVVGGFVWSFALLARTLPQARVLWTEPDMQEPGGEIELVEA